LGERRGKQRQDGRTITAGREEYYKRKRKRRGKCVGEACVRVCACVCWGNLRSRNDFIREEKTWAVRKDWKRRRRGGSVRQSPIEVRKGGQGKDTDLASRKIADGV
jgi:hypothetical protein